MSSLSSFKKSLTKNKGLTNAKQRSQAFMNLDQLNSAYTELADAFSKLLKQLREAQGRIGALETTGAALIELTGLEVVQRTVAKQRTETLEAQAEEFAKHVAADLENGVLIPAEVAEVGCLLVLTDRNKDGVVRIPSRIHTNFNELDPALMEVLQGKKVGDTGSVGPYNSTILAIYKANPDYRPPAPIEAPAAAPEAPTVEVTQ